MKYHTFARVVLQIVLMALVSTSAVAQETEKPRFFIKADIERSIEADKEPSRLANLEASKWNQQGAAFFKEGKYNEAVKAFRKAHETDPCYARHEIAESLVRDGRVGEAIEAYRYLFYNGPEKKWSAGGGSDDGRSLMQFALLLCQARQYTEAIAAYERGVALINVTTGSDAPPLDQHFDATANFNSRRFLAAVHTGFAMELRHGQYGNKDEQLRHAREAVKLQSEYAVAQFYLGSALLKSGKGDEAQAAFRRASVLGRGEVKAAATASLWN